MWLIWLLGCGTPGVCEECLEGPEAVTDQVEGALASLPTDLRLDVEEVLVGEAPAWSRGRLTVRGEHARADTFEMACRQFALNGGLSDDENERLSIRGLPPEVGFDDATAWAFGRACGREAETQEAAFRWLEGACSDERRLTETQDVVREVVGVDALLPSQSFVWESVVDLPESGLPAVTDRWIAQVGQQGSWDEPGEVYFYPVDSTVETLRLVLDVPRWRVRVHGVDDGFLIVDSGDARTWWWQDGDLQRVAPAGREVTVLQDGLGWWVGDERGDWRTYDPNEGLGDRMAQGVDGVVRDARGSWFLREGRWERLDGTALAPSVDGEFRPTVIVDGRNWKIGHANRTEHLISRPVDAIEPWTHATRACAESRSSIGASANTVFRIVEARETGGLRVERVVSATE